MARPKIKVEARVKFNKIGGYVDAVRGEIEDVIRLGVETYMDTASGLMAEPKTGIQYPSLPNRSSAPGEAPAVQEGTLEAGLTGVQDGLTMWVGNTDPKAKFLNYGTSDMAPRPFHEPAVEEARKVVRAETRKRIKGIRLR